MYDDYVGVLKIFVRIGHAWISQELVVVHRLEKTKRKIFEEFRFWKHVLGVNSCTQIHRMGHVGFADVCTVLVKKVSNKPVAPFVTWAMWGHDIANRLKRIVPCKFCNFIVRFIKAIHILNVEYRGHGLDEFSKTPCSWRSKLVDNWQDSGDNAAWCPN